MLGVVRIAAQVGGLSLALALSGCLDGATLSFESATGASAVIWREDGPAVAFEPDSPPILAWPDDAETHLATFSWSLEELGLEAGYLPGTPTPRSSPPPLAIFDVIPGPSELLLESAADPEGVLSTLRLPPLDDLRCLRAGGCRPASGIAVCITPCPDPEAPVAPELPRTPCPDGWLELDEVAPAPLRWCEPPSPPTGLECDAGEVPWFETGACGTIDECPEGAFRDVQGPATFLLEGAADGDGTRAAPYGAFEEVPAADLSGTLVLGPGRYVLDGVFRGERIVGRCAADTELVSSAGPGTPIAVSAAGGLLEHLAVRGGLTSSATVSLAYVRVPEGKLRSRAAVLTAAHSHIRLPRYALRAHETGHIVLRDVTVEGGAAVECLDPGSRLTLERIYSRGADGPGLLVADCKAVDVAGLIVESATVGVRLYGASGPVQLEDLWIRDVDDQAFYFTREGMSAPATSVRIERAFVSEVDIGLEAHGGYQLTIRDFAAVGLSRWALRVLTANGPLFDIDIERVWAHDTGGLFSGKRGEFSSGTPPVWALRDAMGLHNHDSGISPTLEGVLRLSDGARFEGRRLYLGDGKRLGLVAWSSEVDVEDITAVGPLIGFEFRSGQDSTATRLAAVDVSGIGLVSDTTLTDGGALTVRDLRVETRADVDASAVGVQCASVFGTRIERFAVDGPPLAISANAETQLSQGRLTDCEVGLRLTEDADLAPLISGVSSACTQPIDL